MEGDYNNMRQLGRGKIDNTQDIRGAFELLEIFPLVRIAVCEFARPLKPSCDVIFRIKYKGIVITCCTLEIVLSKIKYLENHPRYKSSKNRSEEEHCS